MGLFIVIEGGDGAGKGEQILRIRKLLIDLGVEHIVTREPGGCRSAEEIRSLLVTGDSDRWTPESELLLFTVARREHIRQVIQPTLTRGAAVICDRFIASTIAYQGAGHGVDPQAIMALHRQYCGLLPDITIVLDVDPEIGLARANFRNDVNTNGEQRFEGLPLDYHRKVRQGLLDGARLTAGTTLVVDASRSIDEVAAEIASILPPAMAAARDDAERRAGAMVP